MEYIIYILLVPLIIVVLVVVGIVSFFNNRKSAMNNMDPNQSASKVSAKDFSLNLGAFIALYILVGSLLNLLFTIINTAYPQITNGYNYYGGSSSISWPVSILVVLFPIFILLMYFLEREYRSEPDKQNNVIHRGLTYITLFVSGFVIVGDLVTVVYYFIDGQELTTGFLLKVLVLLIIASGMFVYYISDLRGKLTRNSRMIWRFISGFIILGSIVWGFAVLGSPATQRLYKYDDQKVSDLTNINYQIANYYGTKSVLPNTLSEVVTSNYNMVITDPQTKKSYEYQKTSDTSYNLCADFNKASNDKNNSPMPIAYPYGTSWTHPAGRYCFPQNVKPVEIAPKPFIIQ